MIMHRPVLVTEIFSDIRIPEFEENPGKRKEYLLDYLKILLKQFDLNETLRHCVHLNLFISVPEKPRTTSEDQWGLVKLFFPEKAVYRVQTLLAKNQTLPRPIMFNRSQILELIQWVLICCPDEGNYSNPVQNNRSKTKFAKALLIAGELATLQDDERFLAEEEDIDKKRLYLLTMVRRLGLPSVFRNSLIRSFGRGKMMFFEFLPQEMSEFATKFQESNDVSLEEYFACLFLVMSRYLNVKFKQGAHEQHFLNIKHIGEQLPGMTNVVTSYLDSEAWTIEELKDVMVKINEVQHWLSLRPLRERPLYWLNEETAMVIDPVLHLDKAMIGPLFMINTPFQERIGYFGKAFEKYTHQILQNMYRGSESRLLLGEELIVSGTNEEICDAALIEEEILFLFEMKAVLIADNILFDEDYEKYPDVLRDKYGKQGHVGDQLARAINNLISGDWTLPDFDLNRARRIYPIIVAYDPYLNLPGHFQFFNADFRIALNPEGYVGSSKVITSKESWEIGPLTIITVDVLENLEESIKKFTLSDLLKDYFDFCDRNFRDKYDDFSLDQYIFQSKYANLIDPRGSVASKAIELFDETKQILFPE